MRKIIAEVSDALYKKLIQKKTEDGYGNDEWSKWFDFLTRRVHLDPTLTEQVEKGTKSLLPMWMKNFGDNLSLIREGKTLRDLAVQDITKSPVHRAVIVGRGPSIFRNNHLDLLNESDFEGIVVASDGVLIDSLKAGVIPDYVLSVDGAPIITKWFDDPIIKEHAPDIKAVICTQVHHDVVNLIQDAGFQIYWFEPGHDDIKQKLSVTKILALLTCSETNLDGVVSMDCGGNVGTASWVFSWSLLKRSDVALIGLDFGYPDDMSLKDTYYYDRTVAHMGALKANTYYEKIWHPIFRTWSKIDPAFKSYREGFFDMILSRPQWQRTVNCTEGGTLFHPSLECKPFGEWLNEDLMD